jgi:multidrug efflux system outer membrane protein
MCGKKSALATPIRAVAAAYSRSAMRTSGRRAADLARTRYKEGATGFLELLDAERVQLAAEDALAQGEAAIDIRAVSLYKALGGGWQACGDATCSAVARAH